MVPFDPAEPIFIVETKDRDLLVVFTSSYDLQIMWIDDYRSLELKRIAAPKQQALSGETDQ